MPLIRGSRFRPGPWQSVRRAEHGAEDEEEGGRGHCEYVRHRARGEASVVRAELGKGNRGLQSQTGGGINVGMIRRPSQIYLEAL